MARKDQFGETLGEFVQDTFLTPDALVARLDAARVVPRVSALAAEIPANADRLAGDLVDAAVTVADLVRDDEVQPGAARRDPHPGRDGAGRARWPAGPSSS